MRTRGGGIGFVVRQLRLTIEPTITGNLRADICATLRLLLTTAGFAWHEVHAEEAASDSGSLDLAVALDAGRAPQAGVVLLIEPHKWRRPNAYQIAGVRESHGWTVPYYAGEHNSAIITGTTDHLIIRRDVLFDIFWQCTGQEEHSARRDRHGTIVWDSHREAHLALRRTPVASSLIQGLTQILSTATNIVPEPKWPAGKCAALTLSHDVDYPEAVRWLEPARILRRLGHKGLLPSAQLAAGKRTHWHFQSWIDLERKYGMASAFYFVARQGSLIEYIGGTPDTFYDIEAGHFRALFRQLDDQGWEIGLHPSYHAYRSRDTLAAEKRTLERAAGLSIAGGRHHYWRLDPADPDETLAIHQSIGMQYDASLAFDRYTGWRRGLCTPYHPYDAKRRRQLEITEIPTGWMDDQLFRRRHANPGDRPTILATLVDTVVRHEGCLMVDIHEYVFDDALFPEWRATYESLLMHVASRSDIWCALPRDIAQHWRARTLRLQQLSHGL
jgi:peptidoglycan/xylan/chitin deacetylase (PgdA/CDA1 family)